MNNIIIQFFQNSWLLVLIVIILLLPIIPTSWLALPRTYMDQGKEVKHLSLSIIESIVHLICKIISRLIIDISILFTFQTTLSLIIFILIGVDLYYRKQIGQNTILLVIIGIIGLYLQQIIDKGKSFKIWKIFEWKSK